MYLFMYTYFMMSRLTETVQYSCPTCNSISLPLDLPPGTFGVEASDKARCLRTILVSSTTLSCNLLRPLIKTLFLLVPYGYIIKKSKRIPKEMTVSIPFYKQNLNQL